MRYAELDALLDVGNTAAVEAAMAADAEQVTPALSGHQVQLLTAKAERIKALAAAVAPHSTEAPAEEPTDVEAEDSEPEQKAEPDKKARRSTPSRSAGKKG